MSKDLTTGKIYSTELAKELKTDKFNSIVTNGYTIKDNGNGIVDENDTIEGNDLNELKTLGHFCNFPYLFQNCYKHINQQKAD